MDLAFENEKEEAAAVLRAHGTLVSLHFAAEKGMPDEVAAGIVAGQHVNSCDQVIFLCVCMGEWVGVAASIVYKSCIYISLYIYTHTHTHTHMYIFINIYIYIHMHTYFISSYTRIYIDRLIDRKMDRNIGWIDINAPTKKLDIDAPTTAP